MKIKTTLILLLVGLFGCRNNETPRQNTAPIVIDLVSAFENRATLKLSSIASSIEYIPLESYRKAILGGGARIFVNDSFIVSSGFKKIDLFDRRTGNYIREIGKIGRGPNEYSSTRHVEAFDEVSQNILARRLGETIIYNLDGIMIQKIKRPEEFKNMSKLEEPLYAAFVPNTEGHETRRVVIYNAESGKTVKIFPNLQFYSPKSYRVSGYEGWFYHYNKQLFFKETFNDTLVQITPNKLIPTYIFDAGKFKPPYRAKNYYENYYTTSLFIENSRFLFFNFMNQSKRFCAYFDKKDRKCHIADLQNRIAILNAGKIYAFENDIDDFISFYPMSINNENELISAIPALEIVNWFKQNPEKIAQLPPELQKLKNIKETDNPVVMIAKLKE